jgi:hypothetical protein
MNSGMRNLIIAGGVAFILPLINAIGVFNTNAITAVFAWIGAMYVLVSLHSTSSNFFAQHRMLWSVVRWGERMRGWVDMGYSTATSN